MQMAIVRERMPEIRAINIEGQIVLSARHRDATHDAFAERVDAT